MARCRWKESGYLLCLTLMEGILAELSRDCRHLCSVGLVLGLGCEWCAVLCVYGPKLCEWDLSSGGAAA